MADSIKIPVSLQMEIGEAQNIINDLKQSMSKLSPDSKAYAGLDRELNRLQKRYDTINAAMKQGFNNPAQLTRFSDKVRSLGTDLQTTAKELTRIKFGDLNLKLVDPAQVDQLKDLERAIGKAQDKLSNFNTDQMREMVGQSKDLQDAFSTLSLDVKTATFDKTMQTAEQKVGKLRERLQELDTRANTTQQNLTHKTGVQNVLNNLSNIFSDNKSARAGFSDIFDKNGNFKRNQLGKGRDILVQYLEDIGLSSQNIENVRNAKATELHNLWATIEKEIKDRGLASQLANSITKLQQQMTSIADERSTAQTRLSNVESLQTQLEKLKNFDPTTDTTHMADAYKTLVAVLDELSKKYKDLQQQIMNSTNVQEDGANAMQRTEASARDWGQGLEESAQSAKLVADNTKELINAQNGIKSFINRWLGFYNIARMVRTAVTNAINNIKELDATMTQIAVVTNMTQADLWGQISTYSAIAQQYGVTTNGVYQVSQLYYQQGGQIFDFFKDVWYNKIKRKTKIKYTFS